MTAYMVNVAAMLMCYLAWLQSLWVCFGRQPSPPTSHRIIACCITLMAQVGGIYFALSLKP
jgi:hypothetical protein